jgi:cytochrome P450
MTSAVYTLSRFPDQMSILRGDMSLMPDALEELMRHTGPVHYTQPRTLKEPMQLEDIEIPAGETVLASVAAANRDPDQFPDPDRLDFSRKDVRHLGFSQGLHLCIGAMLARLEASIGLTRTFERFSDIQVTEDPVEYVDYGPMRGIRELHVTGTPA